MKIKKLEKYIDKLQAVWYNVCMMGVIYMELLEKYREELTNIRNCISSKEIKSDKTVTAYCGDIKKFFEYLKHEDVSKVSPQDIDRFLKLGAPSTANRRFMALLNFYKFLNEIGATNNCPIIKGVTYKKLREIPERMSIHMTMAEGLRFLEEAAKNVRYYAVMMTFLNTGIRESELCNLKIKDYDGQTIRYIAKRNKEKIAAINSETRNAIDNYLKTREIESSSEYLLPSGWGNKYSATAIYMLVKNIAKRAGITKDITPHKLRHTYAAMMRSKGEDILTIRNGLGHEHLDTTDIYLKTLLDERDIEAAERGAFNVNLRTVEAHE